MTGTTAEAALKEADSTPGRESGMIFSGDAPPSTERRGPGTYDRRKSPEERWAEQHRRLLLASAHVLARDGAASASVASVLEAAGLSRGTFYRHFSDLGEAFHAVRREAALLLFKAVDDELASKTDPAERLSAGITSYLRLIADHGDLARAFLSEPRANGATHEELHRMVIDRFAGLIQEGLERAVAGGAVKEMPPGVTIYAMVHAIEGVGLRHLKNGDEHRAVESAPALVNLCLKAFS